MKHNPLHITNGSSLTSYLKELDIKGNIITWHEMLCEGPTIEEIESEAFIVLRKSFFKKTYNIEYREDEYKTEVLKFSALEAYTEVVLWFEFDLFCHINLIAVISLLKRKKVNIPIYLVCSGWVDNEKQLKGLSQLTPEQIKEHYTNKVKLNVDDISLAQKAWKIYCSNNHSQIKPLIVTASNFKYLSNCLTAHIRRFADSRSGLSNLEYNILKLIKEHSITSRHHLLGYALHYQGYYGFGDIQLERIIDNLDLFYAENDNGLTLNRKGHLAIELQASFFNEMNTDFEYGGTNKSHFQYDKKEDQLIKTV